MDNFIVILCHWQKKYINRGLVWRYIQGWGASTGVIAWTTDFFFEMIMGI